jgi:hypothetical protein
LQPALLEVVSCNALQFYAYKATAISIAHTELKGRELRMRTWKVGPFNPPAVVLRVADQHWTLAALVERWTPQACASRGLF